MAASVVTVLEDQYVFEYNWATFKHIVQVFTKTSDNDLEEKQQLKYLQKYLGEAHLGVRTLVLENEYTDRDYLEDFASYYVKCFTRYEPKCARLHFFKQSFGKAEFEALLLNADSESIQGLHPLGFMVLKPLPKQFIGRTCLTPEAAENRTEAPSGIVPRSYIISRGYKSNLFGLDLQHQTLAFQEQDRVAAACATSAVWTSIQATAVHFRNHVPSPANITKKACKYIPAPDRIFPNTGLSVGQILNAYKSMDLDPLLINLFIPPEKRSDSSQLAEATFKLKSTLAAYMPAGIPVVMGSYMGKKGGHATTVTGLRFGGKVETIGFDKEDKPSFDPNGDIAKGTMLSCTRIDELLTHDDQVGPYAQLMIPGTFPLASAHWHKDFLPIVPSFLIVPLYHKIRIPLDHILKIISESDATLSRYARTSGEAFEWDVRLANVSEVNTWARTCKSDIDPQRMLDFLRRSKPRFIWWASAWLGTRPFLELFFDATDIESGGLLFGILLHHERFRNSLQKIATKRLKKSSRYSKTVFEHLALP